MTESSRHEENKAQRTSTKYLSLPSRIIPISPRLISVESLSLYSMWIRRLNKSQSIHGELNGYQKLCRDWKPKISAEPPPPQKLRIPLDARSENGSKLRHHLPYNYPITFCSVVFASFDGVDWSHLIGNTDVKRPGTRYLAAPILVVFGEDVELNCLVKVFRSAIPAERSGDVFLWDGVDCASLMLSPRQVP